MKDLELFIYYLYYHPSTSKRLRKNIKSEISRVLMREFIGHTGSQFEDNFLILKKNNLIRCIDTSKFESSITLFLLHKEYIDWLNRKFVIPIEKYLTPKNKEGSNIILLPTFDRFFYSSDYTKSKFKVHIRTGSFSKIDSNSKRELIQKMYETNFSSFIFDSNYNFTKDELIDMYYTYLV